MTGGPGSTLLGYHRADRRVGARNHVLVLPSVVCATRVARQIATPGAVSISHQHGCAQVGDDVEHTTELFCGVAAHPNVAGVLVVGLGCETIGGDRLAEAIRARGQQVGFVGIQESGGSAVTVARGRELAEALLAEALLVERLPAAPGGFRLGLDDPEAPFASALVEAAVTAGIEIVLADSGGPRGEAAHAELAAAGAQVIVAWCGPGEGPRSFATCPVLSVSGDAALFGALVDDFDLGPDEEGRLDRETIAQLLVAKAMSVFSGEPSAAEQRGAAEFTLRRLSRSM